MQPHCLHVTLLTLPQACNNNDKSLSQNQQLQHTLYTASKLFFKHVIISGEIYKNLSHCIYKPTASSTEAHSPSLSVLRTTLPFKTNCLSASNQSICQKASIPMGQKSDLIQVPKALLRQFLMFLIKSLKKKNHLVLELRTHNTLQYIK